MYVVHDRGPALQLFVKHQPPIIFVFVLSFFVFFLEGGGNMICGNLGNLIKDDPWDLGGLSYYSVFSLSFEVMLFSVRLVYCCISVIPLKPSHVQIS